MLNAALQLYCKGNWIPGKEMEVASEWHQDQSQHGIYQLLPSQDHGTGVIPQEGFISQSSSV